MFRMGGQHILQQTTKKPTHITDLYFQITQPQVYIVRYWYDTFNPLILMILLRAYWLGRGGTVALDATITDLNLKKDCRKRQCSGSGSRDHESLAFRDFLK
jgi:hypothetical protein